MPLLPDSTNLEKGWSITAPVWPANGTTVWSRGNKIAAWLVVGIAGWLEGAYGRTQYLGDWISYLNVSRVVSAHNWRAIFNPMWNAGYPVLVSLARAFAPATPEGEWYAITGLNWVIFLGAYACWRYLISRAIAYHRPASAAVADHPLAIWTLCSIFLACCLGLDNASDVSPDLLVTTVFIAASGWLLDLIMHPTLGRAASMGGLLGLAIWVKGVFSVLIGIFILTMLLVCLAKRMPWRALGVAVAVCFPLYACYVAAVSWSFGGVTFGASGVLNYAWHVNGLPHWTNWQGGPSQFGLPIHPTRQLLPGLPIFEFGSPFHSTYPPFNDVAYWYEGFHHFYNPRLQFIAIGRSLYNIARIAARHPILLCVAIALLTVSMQRQWRQAACKATKSAWPLLLMSLAGIGAYVAVHVEDRYLGAFVLILSLFSLAPLLDRELPFRKVLAATLAFIYIAGAATELAWSDGAVFGAALHEADFRNDPQWKLAVALTGHRLMPGDAVAVIRDSVPPWRSSWAYVSRLRIVAEFGGLPWRIAPGDRTRFARDSGPGYTDYGQMFWSRLEPKQRAEVIKAFATTGARVIVSLSKPDAVPAPGWQHLLGTDAWIYDLRVQ